MLVIPQTFDSESSNLNFDVFRLTFANFTRLTAVKPDPDLDIRGGGAVIQTLGKGEGGRSPKNFFSSFGPQFGLKISGGGAPRPLLWIRHCVTLSDLLYPPGMVLLFAGRAVFHNFNFNVEIHLNSNV